MEYRPFGQTGIQISAIGIGCWEIGGGYGSIEETEFIKAVNRALDLGINCFDTAQAYGFGASERSLAKALGSRRKEAVITTKFGVGYKDAPNFRDSSRRRIMESIESSLTALNTDYVDVYMVHWPDVNTPFEETMRALDELVQQGKVRAVGISNFRLSQIEASMKVRRIDVAQYCWNMFDRRMQKEIFPYCREHTIGVMAYGSLAYGLLTGAFTEDTNFESDDWRSRRGRMGGINLFQHLFGPEYFPKNIRVVEDLKGVAKRYGKSLPQFALRWTLSNPVVSTALVGCRNVAEVDDNVGALGWSIADADMKEIDAIFARHGVDPAPNLWLERD
ncbi:MAG TPA: aldo/keto reductase [Methylomirabilota bacterium]|jgi:aryl-alcohol dehydrogenase-like predicted oxidoreductase|nr:aldo/keto reductase [Methylomirabilota bacterium]